MNKLINILYISISGNTASFIDDLSDYAEQQHNKNANMPLINAREISDATDSSDEKQPFFAFVPTYLDGGNGIDNGVLELMTNSLGEYIDYHDNAKLCLGVVGSGNKNFNQQYCLTAKRYAKKFNTELIADYELRGNNADCVRIYNKMTEVIKEKLGE